MDDDERDARVTEALTKPLRAMSVTARSPLPWTCHACCGPQMETRETPGRDGENWGTDGGWAMRG